MLSVTRLLTTLFLVALYTVHAFPTPQPLPDITDAPTNHTFGRRQSGSWTLVQNGDTGVAAMMFVVVSPTLVLIMDKVENNALTTPGNGNPAWAALYNLQTQAVTPIQMKTNTFCAGGAFISNGSFVSTGGNNIVSEYEEDDGLQGLRLFQPCTSPTGSGCTVYEDPLNFHLLENRWYPTVVRLYDGTAMITGGTSVGGFYNNIRGLTPLPTNTSLQVVV